MGSRLGRTTLRATLRASSEYSDIQFSRLTFVTFRWLAALGIIQSLGREPAATLVWLSWSMPLLAAEAILQGRKVVALRSAV